MPAPDLFSFGRYCAKWPRAPKVVRGDTSAVVSLKAIS